MVKCSCRLMVHLQTSSHETTTVIRTIVVGGSGRGNRRCGHGKGGFASQGSRNGGNGGFNNNTNRPVC